MIYKIDTCCLLRSLVLGIIRVGQDWLAKHQDNVKSGQGAVGWSPVRQHYNVPMSRPSWYDLSCCYDVKPPTSKQANHPLFNKYKLESFPQLLTCIVVAPDIIALCWWQSVKTFSVAISNCANLPENVALPCSPERVPVLLLASHEDLKHHLAARMELLFARSSNVVCSSPTLPRTQRLETLAANSGTSYSVSQVITASLR